MVIKETRYLSLDKPEKVNLKYIVRCMKSMVMSPIYKCIMNFRYPQTIEKKYNVSICAIFRDESKYLKEWISYHLVVGIEHFYLYNNFSEDDFLQVLQPFIDKGQVTLINWPVHLGQLSAYADCISKYSDQTKWIGFIDLDEFVVPNKMNSIYQFLQKFEKKRPAVLVYWKYFGSSGKIERDEVGLVIEDFTICWEKFENMGKCFFNTKYSFNPQNKHNMHFHHNLWGRYMGIELPPVNMEDKPIICGIHHVHTNDFPIQINHYVVKSYKEYWDKKAKKGGGTHDVGMHDNEYFWYHESKCQSADYHIFRFLIKLKRKLWNDK